MPYVKDMSKEWSVEGLLFGKEKPGPLPFPVRKGDKATAAAYGVSGVPALVALKNGALKLKISGANDIKNARTVLRAFDKGAMSVSEVMEKSPTEEIIITGWVIHKGKYFDKNARFFITDRRKELMIDPWLPMEVMKSPFKKQRPRMMSDVIDKPAALKGRLVKNNDEISFHVKEEINL